MSIEQLVVTGLQYLLIMNMLTTIKNALLKALFNQCSPQPRYVFIWNIQAVLDFVKSQWSGCDLSDEVLTYKVVILMTLSSASRASVIHHLDVRYMLRPEGTLLFTFHKLHKSWKHGKATPSLEFCECTGDRDLCVVTLNEYIKHKYQRRSEKRRSQLLLSFIQPYVEVSSSNVSIWIKEALKLAGVDVSTFKGHSTRAVSSSKARVQSDKSRLGKFNIRSTEVL